MIGNFYPLTSEVAKKLRTSNLTAAEWRIWSYLTEIDPWGDRYQDFSTLVLLEECGVSKATFYRAIAKFQELEIFDFQDNGFSIRNIHGVSSLKNETRFSKMRQDSQKCESCLKNEKVVSKMRQDSQKCENQTPEPLHNKDSNSSQTIQIEKDTKDTTNRGGCEKSFLKKPADEIFAKYEEKLKYFGITRKIWPQSEPEPIENPRIKPILQAIDKTPDSANRAIAAFLEWIKTAKNLNDVYKALEVAILKGWDM